MCWGECGEAISSLNAVLNSLRGNIYTPNLCALLGTFESSKPRVHYRRNLQFSRGLM